MKFRFLGGGDCPDWLLASLFELSNYGEEKTAALCEHLAKYPDRGQLDEKALLDILTDTESNTSPPISTIKVLASCIFYILDASQRLNVPGDVLVGELQQLGLPRSHAVHLRKAAEQQVVNANTSTFLRTNLPQNPFSDLPVKSLFIDKNSTKTLDSEPVPAAISERVIFHQDIPSSTSNSVRENIIKLHMDLKQDDYTSLKELCIFAATWNVNGRPATVNISRWLRNTEQPPDIYAIGFQELDLGKSAFVFDQTPREQEWLQAVTFALDDRASYTKIELVRLVGMMLIVFVNDKHVPYIRHVACNTVGTGILGVMGNKGGVSIRFVLHNTSMCFVNSHLAAHVEGFERRNQDYQDICERTQFNQFISPKGIKDHDQIYWLGDLNYRVTELDNDVVKKLLEIGDYSLILKFDQLNQQRAIKNVFSGYSEGHITFKPTYKYDIGTDNWDSSEKNRTPAWCDRILWKGEHVRQESYTSHPELNISDHKPVSSTFKSLVKEIDRDKYRKTYEEVIKKLDKLENEYLPQVSVSSTEVDFGTVRYLEPYERQVIITNTGQVPVQFEFIKKLDQADRCKVWLNIKPFTQCINTDEKCVVKLEIFVNKKSACKLNSGDDELYDILVLHLEGGKDVFIIVKGAYEQSCFGSSIEALINIQVPIQEISLKKLIHLERNKGQKGKLSYAIPKEIWLLVDHIHRHGLKEKDLFEQPGLHSEIIKIRDWLDYGSLEPIPGSINSAAEALLLMLESTADPIIPYNQYSICLNASSNYMQCKQLIEQLPECHKNVFLYLCAFLKEVLLYNSHNGSDIQTLSALFGSIFIRDPPSVLNHNRNHVSRQNVEQQKANFVSHFLSN